MTTAGTVGVTIEAVGLAQFQATMAAFSASVQQATARMEAATAQFGAAFANNVGGEMERTERRVGRSLDNIGARMRTFSRSMMHAGMMGSFAAGFGGFMVGQALYNSIGTFEEQMAILGVVSGETGRQLELTAQQAEQLGASSALSATQVAQIQVELGKLGMSLANVRALTPAVTDFAVASDMAAERAAEFAGALVNTFGIAATDMAHAMDVVTTAANISAADVDEMAYTFRYAGSAARAAGWSLEETAAAAALMSNAGLDASVAGTALRSILTDIVAPTRMAREQLRAYGLELRTAEGGVVSLAEILEQVKDLPVDAIARIFDMNSTTAILAMRELRGMLPGVYQGLQNVEGATQRLADARMGGLTGALRELSGAFESLMIAMGQAGLSQALQDFMGRVSDLMSSMAQLSNSSLMMVASLAGIAIAIGPIMLALGGLIAMLTGPGGLLIALGAVAIGFSVFNQLSNEIHGANAAMTRLQEPLQRVTEYTAQMSMQTWDAAAATRALVVEQIRLAEAEQARLRGRLTELNNYVGDVSGSLPRPAGVDGGPFGLLARSNAANEAQQLEANLRAGAETIQSMRDSLADADMSVWANQQGRGPLQAAQARAAAQAAAASSQMRQAIDPYSLMAGGSPSQQMERQTDDLEALALAAENGAKAFERLRIAQGLRPDGTGEVTADMQRIADEHIAAQNALAVVQNRPGPLQGRRDVVGELQKEIDRSMARTAEMIAATGGGERALERARIALDLMEKTRGLSRAAADEMATAIEAVNHQFARAQERMARMQQMFDNIGTSIASAFESAILEGRKLGDVLKSLARDIAAIVLRNMVTAPLGSAISTALSGMFGGGKAAGGIVTPNTMYMVGEKGPELFMPSTPGRIMSNGALAGMGGGAVVQLHYAPVIDARGADAAAVARLEAGQAAMARSFEPMVQQAVMNLRARRKI